MEEVHYRDAVTGEYVTKAYALANPATTVREVEELEVPTEPLPSEEEA